MPLWMPLPMALSRDNVQGDESKVEINEHSCSCQKSSANKKKKPSSTASMLVSGNKELKMQPTADTETQQSQPKKQREERRKNVSSKEATMGMACSMDDTRQTLG